MKNVSTFCDRCLEPILSDGTAIEAVAGNLRRRRGPVAIDLCGDCAESFLEWLATAPGRESAEL